MDISRKGQMSWRKCYNEMCKAGLFKGNRVRKRKLAITEGRWFGIKLVNGEEFNK